MWHLPVRLAAGAFVLDSGLSKRGIDGEHAAQLHGFATSAFPEFKEIEPTRFVRLLSAGEVALGGALLVPVVPPGLAGAGLSAFAAGLMRLYLRSPGLRQPDSLRPTEQGLSNAKDSWLLAIGLALVIDSLSPRRPRLRRR